MALAIFVSGHSALQPSRDLGVQHKTAFALAHKVREAMASKHEDRTLSGHVEINGAYFGGYVKPETRKEDRIDRGLQSTAPASLRR